MDKESRKKQILQSACSLFAHQGYDATTIAQIAKQCGCSSPLVIRHFGSKENLYNALLEQLKEVCRQPLLTEAPVGTAMERLEALYNTLVFEVRSIEDTHPELISALQSRGDTQAARAEAMRCMQDVGMEFLLPAIRSGVEEGFFPPDFPCEKIARLMWLYINGDHIIRANYPSMKPLPFSAVRRLLLKQ